MEKKASYGCCHPSKKYSLLIHFFPLVMRALRAPDKNVKPDPIIALVVIRFEFGLF